MNEVEELEKLEAEVKHLYTIKKINFNTMNQIVELLKEIKYTENKEV